MNSLNTLCFQFYLLCTFNQSIIIYVDLFQNIVVTVTKDFPSGITGSSLHSLKGKVIWSYSKFLGLKILLKTLQRYYQKILQDLDIVLFIF